MHLRKRRAELKYLTQRVSRLLGEDARLFQLDYDLEMALLRMARREETLGLGDEAAAVRMFRSNQDGRSVSCGMVRYSLKVGRERISVVQIVNPFSNDRNGMLNDCWGVATRGYPRLYRLLRRAIQGRLSRVTPPVMPADEQQRL